MEDKKRKIEFERIRECINNASKVTRQFCVPSGRIEWLREVAYNFARVTRKYDRFSVYKTLSEGEYYLLLQFEAEESLQLAEEAKRKAEEAKREAEEAKREAEEAEREYNGFKRELDRKASSSVKCLFPIGEA